MEKVDERKVEIPEVLLNRIVQYLVTRPFFEVHNIMRELEKIKKEPRKDEEHR